MGSSELEGETAAAVCFRSFLLSPLFFFLVLLLLLFFHPQPSSTSGGIVASLSPSPVFVVCVVDE